MGIEEDRFGRKKRSLEELKRLLNDLKNERKDWSDRIDRLVKALEAENLKVSQDISTSLKNDADEIPRNSRGEGLSNRVKAIQGEFEFYRNACGNYDPFNWVKIGKQ
jgi:chromosome segregation ATPase